ncbi:acetyltransferase [Paenibacillus hamazuiensis]|uniref:acetyltransferase n=1 Tax=Paenibacillus hamazuiensis TaxID=2936508 RepID=UPI003B848D3A
MLSPQPHIHETAQVGKSTVGGWTSIGARSRINESSFGDYSYCVDEVVINYAEIGKFCSIASHVCINPVNHPMWRVTQHHMTYRRAAYGFKDSDDEEFFDWRRSNRVEIGHDVWIGHGAFVMSGVKVGTGAVIGSGAIVTKDVEPYTIVVGVPARPIRERFPRDIAAKLLDIAWWDWTREELEKRFDDFNDLAEFLRKFSK